MTKQTSTTEILRSVQSLLTERFFIPKYQRGYRWKENQINDLLNDIDRFTPSNDEDKNSWYCLQPLVVKQSEDGWRLIDGQQRLTSIKLILHYLNKNFFYANPLQLYPINYETRGKDEEWLTIVEDEKRADDNIDYTHIYTVYQAIKKWFNPDTNSEKTPKDSNYISEFTDKLLNNCKFIWYDIDQNGQNNDSEEDVFIRLNVGKIPLTNSELIKALFLNSSNFAKDKNEKEIRLRQLEISTQWDNIEQELADDEFWYFINGKENNTRPRIEYLFDVIAKKPQKVGDKYYTFRYFQTKFEENECNNGDKLEFVNRQWGSVFNKFLTFKEWFNDKYYYHLIGYLLCMDYEDKVAILLDEFTSSKKDEFRHKLSEKIRNSIKWDGKEIVYYGDFKARRILLLHNVETMRNQEDRTSRFSFFQYIGTKDQKGWDIEHIQARAEKIPEKENHRKEWLNEIKGVITDEKLFEEIENFADLTDNEKYKKLFDKVNGYFEQNSSLTEEDEENMLSNLALLDASTNRGYGNEFYPVKRRTILEKDKNGVFIPVCTKKVFMKHYTDEVSNMTFWSKKDRDAYIEDIKSVLKPYFNI
ncbi:MAG: DUF262 domain-containing protein [Bacteroidaceae bacterium]|jgi:uncharacterized protein with ParB-like and HNH nuclease domain